MWRSGAASYHDLRGRRCELVSELIALVPGVHSALPGSTGPPDVWISSLVANYHS